MKSHVSRYSCIGLVLLLSAGVVPALGSTIALTDQNSVVSISPDTQSGVYNWSVDGVNQLFQQWFWYRTGGTANAEQSIDTLSAPVISGTSANSATFTYTGSNGLTAQIGYVLTGGASGSMTSDLGESIKLTNTTTAAMDLHFFQYSDFDLNGTPGGDTVVFTNANAVDQYKTLSSSIETLAETVTTTSPHVVARWEGDFYPAMLNSLNNGTGTTLSNTPAIGTPLGTGDVTWAYEWDYSVPAGQSLLISKDKNISLETVPEPGTLALLAGGCIALACLRRRWSA